MFRGRFQANAAGLPTTSSASASAGASLFNLGSRSRTNGAMGDGSARSIHLQSPIASKWRRSSRAVKNAYIAAIVAFIVMILGWRSMTYKHAKVHMECTSTVCTITIRPMRSKKSIKVTDIPRHQIVGAKPVKVNAEGVVVNHNVNINEEWKFEGSNKKKVHMNNYKGPDKDGNYLTYVIQIQNKDPNEADSAKANPPQTEGQENHEAHQEQPPSVDLSPILPFMVRDEMDKDNPNSYLLVLRQQGLEHARRKVRSMVQKIDSYAKRRRHKIVAKETSTPDWKAVLMLVLGGCVFILSCLLGMFWEDDEDMIRNNQGGPGARRRQQQQQQGNYRAKSNITTPYQRSIPAKYEVSTTPTKTTKAVTRSAGYSSSSSNTTTTIRRRNG